MQDTSRDVQDMLKRCGWSFWTTLAASLQRGSHCLAADGGALERAGRRRKGVRYFATILDFTVQSKK